MVPPKNRKDKREHDKEVHKQRNEVERLFCRLKGYRHVFTRHCKLDVTYTGFNTLALIHENPRVYCKQPLVSRAVNSLPI